MGRLQSPLLWNFAESQAHLEDRRWRANSRFRLVQPVGHFRQHRSALQVSLFLAHSPGKARDVALSSPSLNSCFRQALPSSTIDPSWVPSKHICNPWYVPAPNVRIALNNKTKPRTVSRENAKPEVQVRPLFPDPTQPFQQRGRVGTGANTIGFNAPGNRCLTWYMFSFPLTGGFDSSLTKTVLGKLPDTDQAILRLVLNGSFFANDKVHKYDPNQTELCPLCQEPDSMHHRHWECAATQASRQAIPAGIGSLELLHECTRERGWATMSPQQIRWMKRLLEPVTFEYRAPHSESDAPLNLFTDGSAQSPQDPVLRYAAWAVAAVHEHDIWESRIVTQGPLPGLLQTVPRAETYAVKQALEVAIQAHRPVQIWSDCLGVVRKMHAIWPAASPVGPTQETATCGPT